MGAYTELKGDMEVKCYWMEETDMLDRWLRRYAGDDCPVKGRWYHEAMVQIERLGGFPPMTTTPAMEPDRTDPRWNNRCECGYKFKKEDPWQLFTSRVYKRSDTGELVTVKTAPPGGMFDAWWYGDSKQNCGADGIRLIVLCPPDSHTWHVDGRASNCTMPNDDDHKCWVRHGDPKTGIVTVDKAGLTCAAGAGSIQTPTWHGFLTNGLLSEKR